MNYNTNNNKRARILLIALLVVIIIAGTIFMAALSANMAYASDRLVRCWVLCQPGSQVVVRRTPSKNAMEVGQLEVGDWFETDAVSSNGYIRAYGIGEYGEGWIYCGYVSTEEPVKVGMTYCCVAKNRSVPPVKPFCCVLSVTIAGVMHPLKVSTYTRPSDSTPNTSS